MQAQAEQHPSYSTGMRQVFIIGLGLFVIFLDSTVVNIALPSMVDQFMIPLSTASWIINAYTMTVAILLVFMGKAADLYGKKRMYELGLLLFMLSSLLCAVSPNVELLIAARVLQGISGAMAIPASMTLVRTMVPKEKVGMAMGIWSAVGALAIAIGPSAGGILTEAFSWRYVFYINVPIILLAIFLTRVSLRAHTDQRVKGRLDIAGTLLLSIGLFILIYSFLRAQESGWLNAATIVMIASSLLILCLFTWWQKAAKAPLIELEYFSGQKLPHGRSVQHARRHSANGNDDYFSALFNSDQTLYHAESFSYHDTYVSNLTTRSTPNRQNHR